MFVTWCIRPLMFTIYPLWIVIAFILHCCLCLRFTHFELILVLFYIVVSVDKWLREHRLWRRWRNRTRWTSVRPRTSRSPTVGCYSSSSESEAHGVYTWILQIRGMGEKGGGVGGGLLLIWTWITVLFIQIWNNTLLWSKFHIIWHQTKDSLWCYSVLVYIIKFCILKIIFIKSQYWWNNWLRYFFLQEDFCEIEQIIKYNNSDICSSFLRETKLFAILTCILHKVYDKDHMNFFFDFYLVISPCTQSQSFSLT